MSQPSSSAPGVLLLDESGRETLVLVVQRVSTRIWIVMFPGSERKYALKWGQLPFSNEQDVQWRLHQKCPKDIVPVLTWTRAQDAHGRMVPCKISPWFIPTPRRRREETDDTGPTQMQRVRRALRELVREGHATHDAYEDWAQQRNQLRHDGRVLFHDFDRNATSFLS